MKFIIALLVLVLVGISCTRASPQPSVFIWNEGFDLKIGVADLPSDNKASVKLSIPLVYYQDSTTQSSTYNYATKILTFYGLHYADAKPILYVVDCNTWTIVSKTGVPVEKFQYLGLASTNTSSNGLFTTVSDGNFVYPSFIDNENTINIMDAASGSYRGSVYDPNLESYFVAFRNTTGLFMRVYHVSNVFITEFEMEFTNNISPVNDYPLNMFYNPSNRAVMAQVSMKDDNKNTFFSLAYFDWENQSFDVTRMVAVHNGQLVTSFVPVTQSKAYSFASVRSDYYQIYSFDTVLNQFMSYGPFYTPVSSAF
ncbi:hypothetical protein CYY_006576 [Polysphondylium violaceum]|uniref:Uncharacterized protein n=1 Tax=Polysphondylium violaceum TaxID=133409 RepID=A0A8J4PQI7_9MYCE|nr:hypothetical protein CYY_006576 [Polysphondylium violaceum]